MVGEYEVLVDYGDGTGSDFIVFAYTKEHAEIIVKNHLRLNNKSFYKIKVKLLDREVVE